MKKSLCIVALGLLVAACQTTSTTDTNPNNLDKKQVAAAQEIIGSICIVRTGSSANTKGINSNNVVVFGIDKGKEDWIRVDSKILGNTRMKRDNVYFNIKLDKIYCGSSSWNASDYSSQGLF